MSNPYIGEIRMFAGNFAPTGWALCQGQLLSIAQNTALFTLIGTTYGGDGVSTFALPNLQGRFPISQGQGLNLTNRAIGVMGGEETVTLTVPQIAAHNHFLLSNSVGNSNSPASNFWAGTAAIKQFTNATPNETMNGGVLASIGGSQAHANLIPYLAINFIISLLGIFPSQS